MRQFVPAKELASMLKMTPEGLWARAQREAWPWRFSKAGRGRPTREYRIAELPIEIRSRFLDDAIQAGLPAPASAPSAAVHSLPARAGARPLPEAPAPGALARAGALALDAQDPRDLKERQKQTAMARLAVLRRVAEIRDGLQVPLDAAIAALNEHVAREPGETLARLLAKANARPRETGVPVLTRASFYRWSELEAAGGYARLAPQPTRRAALPPWAATFLRLDGTPQRHSLSDVVRQLPKALAADGIACPVPTERQVRWFYDRHVGQLAKWHGRLDARELRNKMPFVRRDFSMLKPADIYTSDGHTFKAMVRHPDQPNRLIRPEVTPVLDVATRKVVGWSASFHENQWDVLAALRHAFETHGVCAVFYVDNGPGFSNNLQKDDVIGMAARLGYTVLHSIPYNSQARGVIERFHGSVLKPLANRFASSVDKHVSKFHRAKVQKLVTLEERRRGLRSPAPTWDEFIAALEQAFADYNAREHRSLARGSAACTPGQRWEQLTAEGWQVARLPVDAEPDLFWPREVRQVTNRGELRLFGRSYFNAVLAEYDGEKVLVSYDQHDDARVIVRDLDQRFICEAALEGNRRPYMPASVIEAAREKSLETAVKRAQRRVDKKAEDLAHFRTIEHQPAEPARFVDIVPAAPAAEERPVFQYQTDRYEWLMGNRDRMTDDDRAWCKRFAASELYQQLVERWQMLGIAWPDDGVEPGFRAAD